MPDVSFLEATVFEREVGNNIQTTPKQQVYTFLAFYLKISEVHFVLAFSQPSYTPGHSFAHSYFTFNLIFHAPFLNLRSAVILLYKMLLNFSYLHLYHRHFILKKFFHLGSLKQTPTFFKQLRMRL